MGCHLTIVGMIGRIGRAALVDPVDFQIRADHQPFVIGPHFTGCHRVIDRLSAGFIGAQIGSNSSSVWTFTQESALRHGKSSSAAGAH